MHLHTITRDQILPVTLERAWAFFSNPSNLDAITPPWLHFRILSSVPQRMHAGLVIEYRIAALAGIPMPWVTEITHAVEPVFFVDEQRLGPYRFWHHQHHFSEVDHGVEMRDVVSYALPFGPLGELAHRLLIRGKLEDIFAYRSKRLRELFGN